MSGIFSQAAAVAAEHLDPATAATWLTLLRPTVALVEAGPHDAVVARLGGQPYLPRDTPWPEWDGVGPLSYVGELNLAALTATGHKPGIPLPATGRLAFFVLDDDYGFADGAHLDSFRVLHLPGDGEPTTKPNGTQTYPEQALTARQVVTAPDSYHPVLPAAFGIDADADFPAWLDHPVEAPALFDAMERLRGPLPRHQVGGWAIAVQGPVELEAAHEEVQRRRSADRGLIGPCCPEKLDLAAESDRWVLLFQVDSYDGALWGDVGTLYWLARLEDLACGDLSDTRFVMQCC